MVGLIVLGALLVLSVLALTYGVDSREESPDPRRSIYPIGLS